MASIAGPDAAVDARTVPERLAGVSFSRQLVGEAEGEEFERNAHRYGLCLWSVSPALTICVHSSASARSALNILQGGPDEAQPLYDLSCIVKPTHMCVTSCEVNDTAAGS